MRRAFNPAKSLPTSQTDIMRVQGFTTSVAPWVIAGSATVSGMNWIFQCLRHPELRPIAPWLVLAVVIMACLAPILRRVASAGRVNWTGMTMIAYVVTFSITSSLVTWQFHNGIRFALSYCAILAAGAVFFWPRTWHFAVGTTAILTPPVILLAFVEFNPDIRMASIQFAVNCVVLSIGLHILVRRAIARSNRLTAEIMYRAAHDGLTGLYSRPEWKALAVQQLAQCQRANRPASLLLLDIDHFKVVNDTYGHDVGDQLLVKLARAIEQTMPKGSIAGRLGGDEFMVFLPSLTGFEARGVASLLEAAFADLTQGGISTTLSIGVSGLRDDRDLDTLLIRADREMYVRKSRRNEQAGIVNLYDVEVALVVAEGAV